jgi:hypothetical protein
MAQVDPIKLQGSDYEEKAVRCYDSALKIEAGL